MTQLMVSFRKNKYLFFNILLNLTVFLLVWYVITFTKNDLLKLLFILPRILLLPLDSLYVSRKIYSTKNKWISVISWVITFFSFLFLMDPWIAKIPWEYSWLMRYEIIQNLTSMIPFFLFILWAIYIIWCDVLLRFIGNKVYRSK
jgi:hypothetical protein